MGYKEKVIILLLFILNTFCSNPSININTILPAERIRDSIITIIDNKNTKNIIRIITSDINSREYKKNEQEIIENRDKTYTIFITGKNQYFYDLVKLLELINSKGIKYTKIFMDGLISKNILSGNCLLNHPFLTEIEFKRCFIEGRELENLNNYENIKILRITDEVTVKAEDNLINLEFIEKCYLKELKKDQKDLKNFLKSVFFKNLKTISLERSFINDFSFLDSLDKLKLKELFILDEPITVIDIKKITEVKNLKKLKILTLNQDRYKIIQEKKPKNQLKFLSDLTIHYKIYKKLDLSIFPLDSDINSIQLYVPTYHGTSNYSIFTAKYNSISKNLALKVPCEIFRTKTFNDFIFPFTCKDISILNVDLVTHTEETASKYLTAVERVLNSYRNTKCNYLLIDIVNNPNNPELKKYTEIIKRIECNVSKINIKYSGNNNITYKNISFCRYLKNNNNFYIVYRSLTDLTDIKIIKILDNLELIKIPEIFMGKKEEEIIIDEIQNVVKDIEVSKSQ